MKINLLCYHLDQGGVEKMVVEYANELVQKGHDVTISTIYKFKPHLFNINEKVKLRKNFGFYIKGMDKIISKIPGKILYKLLNNSDHFDVEVAFQASLPTKVISFSPSKKSKKIAWIHGIGMEYTKEYEKFDNIVFVGEEVKKHYEDVFIGRDKGSLLTIYNPIPKDQILNMSKESINVDFNLNKPYIISVGRLAPEKRFDRLIESYSELISDGRDIDLVLIGEGEERQKIEKLIFDKKLKGRVHLLGFKSNPYPYIRRASLYVCSSDYEGFNVAMTEAAVLKVPIVSTGVYGTTELLGNASQRGIISDFNIKSLTESMIKVLDDKPTQNEFSKLAYAKINEIILSREEKIEKLFNM